MIDKKSWEEFRSSGLLWWINRILHTFGWAIVVQVETDGRVTDVYPARVKFRGFTADSEAEGFKALSKHIAENAEALSKETRIDDARDPAGAGRVDVIGAVAEGFEQGLVDLDERPRPPTPPMTRMVGLGGCCPKCGSSEKRAWFGLGRVLGCIQPECDKYYGHRRVGSNPLPPTGLKPMPPANPPVAQSL